MMRYIMGEPFDNKNPYREELERFYNSYWKR